MLVEEKYIEFMVPIYASARFRCKLPDNWNEMALEDQATYFIDNSQLTGRLCHQCADHIESDVEMADHAEQSVLDELIYEAKHPQQWR